MFFKLQKLPYSLDALEPYISEKTINFHYNKHHMGYINNLNAALEVEKKDYSSLDECLRQINNFSEKIRNNAGGHYNHSFFWEILSPNSKETDISDDLRDKINLAFGSLDEFKEKFKEASLGHFGSGWVWLCVDSKKNIFLTTTKNQDNPIMNIPENKIKGTPILGLDIWEHAYYLKYQNRRGDYVAAFWEVVNWKMVSELFETYTKMC